MPDPNKLNNPIYRYNHGDVPGIKECARLQNNLLREAGYKISKNSWDLENVIPIFSGYDISKRPKEYDRKAVERYNEDASNNFKNNFDSKTLDTNKVYVSNMYYKGSKHLKTAFDEGTNDVSGTHTGLVRWQNTTPVKKGWWEILHNIDNKIYGEPFTQVQGANRNWGITNIVEPKKKTFMDKAKDVIKPFIPFWQSGGRISISNTKFKYLSLYKSGGSIDFLTPLINEYKTKLK